MGVRRAREVPCREDCAARRENEKGRAPPCRGTPALQGGRARAAAVRAGGLARGAVPYRVLRALRERWAMRAMAPITKAAPTTPAATTATMLVSSPVRGMVWVVPVSEAPC